MGHKRLTNPKPLPELGFTPPMECAPVSVLPEGDRWRYEIKHDGQRAQAIHNPSGIKLLSRNGRDLGAPFARFLPELASAIPSGAKLDGELVALDERGASSLQLLQSASSTRAPLVYFAFDLLALAGKDLASRTLEERRYLLQTFLRASDGVQISEGYDLSATEMLLTVREHKLEGVVAKRQDSPYEAGRRTGAWSKLRLTRKQEFVIGGFSRGPHGFNELIIGYYRAGQLRECALVRDGFVPETRRAIHARLAPLTIRTCPFTNLPHAPQTRQAGNFLTLDSMRQCVWIRPEVVGQFGFMDWTANDELQHAKFLGLRDDKDARTVTREILA